ncbi:CHC2 zinc finger domain-containing protein [Roseburia intestinalis]
MNLFYGGYSMNLFQNVKYGVNCREAAERYGVSINRQGKALCPFHNDRHPSLYVADDHFYCFACGAHGDVIDFAANFFDLPLYEAAQRLAADFGVDANQPPTKEVLEKRRQKAEAQQLMENERLCVSVLSDYARVLRSWKMQYALQSPAEAPDERFEEACHKLDEAEYYLDILAFGDSYERAEVVNYLLVDGRLDKLKEKINGRDAA